MRLAKLELRRWKAELEALDRECFPADSRPDWERAQWWGVFDGEKLVGYCGAYVHRPDNALYLYRAGVAEGCRGRGLQRRMVRVRVRYAAKLGVRGCYTYTTADNFASANNLIRCGFRLFGPARRWGGKSCLYWWRGMKR